MLGRVRRPGLPSGASPSPAVNTYYDILNNKYIGFNAATKLLSSCECWAVTLSVGQNINPAKTSFNFNFNLLGLGSSQSTLR
jgi:hypothetical protein